MSIDFSSWDVAALAAAWRGARPFPHLVLDRLVDPLALDALRAGVAREPHWPERGEIVEVMASGPSLTQAATRRFADALGSPAGLAAVSALSGRKVARLELRSYVYLAGGFLLPHTDHRAGIDRRVACAFYLSHDGSCDGGELGLYACGLDGRGEIVQTELSARIAPRANRLVLFDVSPTSLHEVREVTAGARVSLGGWFL